MNKLSPETGKRFTVEIVFGNYYIATKHPRDIIAMCERIENADQLCDRANAYHANQQEIADLKAKVERLRDAMKQIDTESLSIIGMERLRLLINQALKETEASHD